MRPHSCFRRTAFILLLLLGAAFLPQACLPAYAQNETWVQSYNGPGNSYDFAAVCKTDRAGNVYVAGSATGSGTGKDYTLIKYRSDGTLAWLRSYNGTGNGNDVPAAMAIDGEGNAYITGSSVGPDTMEGFATLK